MAVYVITDNETGQHFECSDDEYILDAAEDEGFNYPYSDRAGASSTSVALKLSGSVDQSDGSFLTEGQKLAGFVLTDSAYPLSDCTFIFGAEGMLADDLNGDVLDFWLDIVDGFNSLHEGELNGDASSPFQALAHYMFGDGSALSVDINNIGLDIDVSKIPAINNLINSDFMGSAQISEDFTRNTAQDSLMTASYLGNISLKTEGVFTSDGLGNWRYDGVVRAYDDFYDANPSTHRDFFGESSTAILDSMKGTPYPISIPGELPISGVREN